MQNIDGVLAHPIENTERVANDRDDADLGALRDARSSFGRTANAIDDILQPVSDSFGYRETGVGGIISRDLVEISERPSRIDQLHTTRNLAKAALISASVAVSPASIEAIAASMIRSSSRV